MRAAKEVLRYLRGTTRLGVVYSGSEPLQGFVDADWAGDIDGRRSTTGFVFTCNGGPIAWATGVVRIRISRRNRIRIHADAVYLITDKSLN